MSYLAHARAVILRRSSERSERSEVSHASGDAREQLETQTLDSSLSSLNSLLQTPTESPAAANDTLEPAALTLDGEGLPAAPYPSCGGVAFHQAPGAPWRCSVCEPAAEPPSAGWQFCALPQAADDRTEIAPIPEPPSEEEPLSWLDDKGWLCRWMNAGATLPAREPVIRAWLATAPAEPLPRCLAAVELRRIAAQHGITVEIER
jgi:hypothetical protein